MERREFRPCLRTRWRRGLVARVGRTGAGPRRGEAPPLCACAPGRHERSADQVEAPAGGAEPDLSLSLRGHALLPPQPRQGDAHRRAARDRRQAQLRMAGGIGADAAVVAYSAICAHQLTYPTREISFISYRGDKTPGNRHAQVIHCCSEHSQYDPADGGRVVAGPAPQPLAAILLDYDRAADELYAVGTLGGEMFADVLRQVRVPARARARRQGESRGRRHLRRERTGALLPAAGEVLSRNA